MSRWQQQKDGLCEYLVRGSPAGVALTGRKLCSMSLSLHFKAAQKTFHTDNFYDVPGNAG